MNVQFTKPFIRDYQRLPAFVQAQFNKQLGLLLKDLRHPSLQARVVDKRRRIWKVKLASGYRFTFELQNDLVTVRAIGSHNEMERPAHW